MKCPVCKTSKLVRAKYEGLAVRHCEKCKGYLVLRNRLDGIKVKREKSDEDFLKELAESKGEDTKRRLICSRCTRGMEKQVRRCGPERYFVDECKDCNLIWLDGGELARFQLQYENSDKAEELFRFRDRLATMTDEERKEYEANIAKLPGERIFDKSDYALMACWAMGYPVIFPFDLDDL